MIESMAALSQELEKIDFSSVILEKIGVACRAFHVFRSFNVVPFGNSEYEDFFCLACLAASLCACDSETEVEDGSEIIAPCLKLCWRKQEEKINKLEGTK